MKTLAAHANAEEEKRSLIYHDHHQCRPEFMAPVSIK